MAAVVALDLCGVHPVLAESQANLLLPANPMDGVDPRTMEAFFRSLGWPVQSGNMTHEDLRFHCSLNRPVVCLVTYDGYGHWVVVYDVTPRVVRFFCPVVGCVKASSNKFAATWVDTDRGGVKFTGFGVVVLGQK